MFVIKNRFTAIPVFTCDAATPKEAVQMAREAGEELVQADFTRMDLRGADFSHMNVREASFAQAHLTQAKFTSAALESAVFSRSTGIRVDFRGAMLRYTTFRYVMLGQANFTGADCRSAHFQYAQLAQSRMIGANMADAVMYGADILSVEREWHQFTESQHRHYRDSLRQLLCDHPELITPLHAKIREVTQRVQSDDVQAYMELISLADLCHPLLPHVPYSVFNAYSDSDSYLYACQLFSALGASNTRGLIGPIGRRGLLDMVRLWLQIEENARNGVAPTEKRGAIVAPRRRNLHLPIQSDS